MSDENLVVMANRIGEFFESMPDREEGLRGIAEHIRKHWEPRMRRALLRRLEEGDPGLSAMVCEALRVHRGELLPQNPGLA